MGIIRIPNDEKIEEKNDLIALNQLHNIKQHLSDAAVDNLNTITDWKAYMKKRNKLLKAILKRYKNITE